MYSKRPFGGRRRRDITVPFCICLIVMVFAAGNLSDDAVRGIIAENIPLLNESSIKLPKMSSIIFGFDLSDPKTILCSQVSAMNVDRQDAEQTENEEEAPPPPQEQTQMGAIVEDTIVAASASGYDSAEGVYIKNSTTYTIDANELLNRPINFDKSAEGPKILITHTHSTEAYKPTDSNLYDMSDTDRTLDTKYSVVRVGAEMAEVLNDAGIETVHDTALHDYPSYNGSYMNTLESTEEYLKKYPSIQMVLDVHRDAISRGANTQLKVVTDIKGQKAAQVMIVSGCDQGGLQHPNWSDNLAFAVKLQQSMNTLYANLARPVDFRQERFNMHTTPNSLILEVGSNANTLEEAIIGGRATANALVRLLSK